MSTVNFRQIGDKDESIGSNVESRRFVGCRLYRQFVPGFMLTVVSLFAEASIKCRLFLVVDIADAKLFVGIILLMLVLFVVQCCRLCECFGPSRVFLYF